MRRVLLICCLATLGACASGNRDTTALEAEDFIAQEPTAPDEPEDSRLVVGAVQTATPEGMREGLTGIGSYVGEPEETEPTEPPLPAEHRVLADAKVGDINGRPIYANKFLEPLEDQMIAEAKEQGRSQWTDMARALIQSNLMTVLQDDLLEKEALSKIPPNARQVGLLNFTQQLRDDLRSENRGSATMASRRTEETEELTVEELLDREIRRELIAMEIRQLMRRVQVSWFDIELYYERNWTTFNPDPTAKMRRIYVASEDADAVAEVTRKLEAGEPFARVAALPLNRAPDDGAFEKQFEHSFEKPFNRDRFREANFFRADTYDAYNKAIRGLEPGAWAGPIEQDGRHAWFSLESIETESRSIYEAQAEIEQLLRTSRFRDEEQRYYERLIQQTDTEQLDLIVDRLLRIASERYYPEDA